MIYLGSLKLKESILAVTKASVELKAPRASMMDEMMATLIWMESNSAVMKVGVTAKAQNLAVTKADVKLKAQNLAWMKACSHLHRMVPSWPPLDHS